MAGCIYRLRVGASKEDVRAYASRFYDLNFTLDDIRERYTFDVSCAGSVPQAIEAFRKVTAGPAVESAQAALAELTK